MKNRQAFAKYSVLSLLGMMAMIHARHLNAEPAAEASFRPLTIHLSTVIYPVPHAKEKSWTLSINSAGKAQLVVGGSKANAVEFIVPQEQMKEIARVVDEQQFFQLKLADPWVQEHSPEVTLTIARGMGAKTIELGNNLVPGPSETAEGRSQRVRFVRVLLAIRRLVNRPDAVDFTKDYQRTLADLEKN